MSSTQQNWNASTYDDQHAFVWKYGAGVFDWLAPQPGERILDLGCGTGHLTAKIAESGAEVVGADASPEMLSAARHSFPALQWQQIDARSFHFDEPFDAVYSNAVLHWIPAQDSLKVARNVARALKPGGRFVFEMGGRGNIAAIEKALDAAMRELTGGASPSTNYFPSLGEYALLLEEAGFSVRRAELFPRPTPLKDGADGMRHWLSTFRDSVLRPLDEATREDVLRRVEDRLRPTLWDGETWSAPYVRLRMFAVKEAMSH